MVENEDSTWRISILRSKNLQYLLPPGSSGCTPIVVVSVDPHLGYNHCKVFEAKLGCDGQNTNSKILLDILNAQPRTKLSFEIILKKNTRRAKGVVVGSGIYELCELVKLTQEKTHSTAVISINLNASLSTPRGSNVRRDNKTSGCPTLQIKLIPPKVAKDRPGVSPFVCEKKEEEKVSEEAENQASEELDLASEKTPGEGPTLPPSPSGIRRRRRRRVLTGFMVESDDEAEETWISESESEEEEPPCYDDGDKVEEDNVSQDPAPTPPSLPWIIRVSSILGMAQPNPGILPSYTMSNEQAREEEAKRLKAVSDAIEWEWWERALCLFTVYRELRVAQREEELCERSLESGLVKEGKEEFEEKYERIYQWLQLEWKSVGGLLIALAGIDAAVFAISPSNSGSTVDTDTLFAIDSQALSAISLSTTATGLGLLCDGYFILRYAWGDVGTFVNSACPSSTSTYSSSSSSSWAYFALSSRIPALCMIISIFFLVTFLLLVAWQVAPPAGLVVLGYPSGYGDGYEISGLGCDVGFEGHSVGCEGSLGNIFEG
ncbi:hypothetical protein BT96DRAFT_889801 [Gymnopus androsaceus JB14]|uniref:Uncharacterized protein n=1 Tax=Gymnopus androsaceus JB14 TaxID=1447944 RepID=A0A6A4GVU9_9AGAR|nr:hypothetical protein BT96DRAFT_889801 [Gymnopus androsaceus JB14]